MIEIFLVVFLTLRIGQQARQKKLSPWKWELAMVACWLGFEVPAVMISYLYTQNFVIASISGALCGLFGYFFVKNRLDRQPPAE